MASSSSASPRRTCSPPEGMPDANFGPRRGGPAISQVVPRDAARAPQAFQDVAKGAMWKRLGPRATFRGSTREDGRLSHCGDITSRLKRPPWARKDVLKTSPDVYAMRLPTSRPSRRSLMMCGGGGWTRARRRACSAAPTSSRAGTTGRVRQELSHLGQGRCGKPEWLTRTRHGRRADGGAPDAAAIDAEATAKALESWAVSGRSAPGSMAFIDG